MARCYQQCSGIAISERRDLMGDVNPNFFSEIEMLHYTGRTCIASTFVCVVYQIVFYKSTLNIIKINLKQRILNKIIN